VYAPFLRAVHHTRCHLGAVRAGRLCGQASRVVKTRASVAS
jgi:hypothetical protein